jgi:hypothetical protein
MLLLHAFQFVSDTNGGIFIAPSDGLLSVYHTDKMSTPCNPTERNVIGSSRVTERAKTKVHFFLSICLHNFLQEFFIRLLKCGGAPSCSNTVLQEAHPAKLPVIYFPEISCNVELSLEYIWPNLVIT